jgi:activating signal cointegrator complex subunit 1
VITEAVQKSFADTGLIVDDKRELKVTSPPCAAQSSVTDALCQLHATLLNTIYRKPRPKGKGRGGARVPFDYPALLRTPAFAQVRVGEEPVWLPSVDASQSSVEQAGSASASLGAPEATEAAPPAGVVVDEDEEAVAATGVGTNARAPPLPAPRARTQQVRVNLGTWDVDELQICEMGSHGPEGEYVCVARIALA